MTFALFLCFILAVLAFYQFKTELDRLESSVLSQPESGGSLRLDAVGQQMDILRNRLNGLMVDSVEIRLKALERNIASGQVRAEDLGAFQSLQNDLRLLQSSSADGNGAVPDSTALDHPRYQAAAIASAALMKNADVLKEISRLRTLLYFCLTGFVACSGVLASRNWIASRRSATDERSESGQQFLPRRRSG